MASKKAATAKSSAPKKRATASQGPKARWIRNLRNHPVHLRITRGDGARFFAELKSRGEQGDYERVPADATDSREFIEAVNFGLVEIVTQTELKKLQYPAVGYLQRETQIVRQEDRDVARMPDWDGKGRRPMVPPEMVGQRFAPATITEVPGGTAKQKTLSVEKKVGADDMLPEGVDVTSRRVVVERVRA